VVLQGYEAYFPEQPHIVIARDRNETGVDAALAEAYVKPVRHRGARIWLVRSHVLDSEQAAWEAAFKQQKLTPVWVGSDGLSLLHVS
jgi:hypothetical protein